VLTDPPQKFQHRYWLHVILFLLTLLTTTFMGSVAEGPEPGRFVAWLLSGAWVISGLWYSLPILTILGAHEFGHYIYCRRHNVDATLPYFIPAPPPFITGTFGAVIRIREAFPSKRALFDIGVAGPIAGFVALIPFLVAGVAMSEIRPTVAAGDFIKLGDPLLIQGIIRMQLGAIPDGSDLFLHPMAFAAWFGMLATALNLMPFGQLDGGHILYSILGRRASYVSLATLVAAVGLTFQSASWVSVTVMMLIMALLLGLRHPRVIDEDAPLDGPRKLVALLALVIFILCFTPAPLEIFIREQ
jgi:membrane-associated protease RseP (regulator of RpoE activity)